MPPAPQPPAPPPQISVPPRAEDQPQEGTIDQQWVVDRVIAYINNNQDRFRGPPGKDGAAGPAAELDEVAVEAAVEKSDGLRGFVRDQVKERIKEGLKERAGDYAEDNIGGLSGRAISYGLASGGPIGIGLLGIGGGLWALSRRRERRGADAGEASVGRPFR